jgi:uncharacterized protein YjbJ (UPF0337 family)
LPTKQAHGGAPSVKKPISVGHQGDDPERAKHAQEANRVAFEDKHRPAPNEKQGATASDKVIGKVQKVIGKYTHNPNMAEEGETRAASGKAAAQAEARALKD